MQAMVKESPENHGQYLGIGRGVDVCARNLTRARLRATDGLRGTGEIVSRIVA